MPRSPAAHRPLQISHKLNNAHAAQGPPEVAGLIVMRPLEEVPSFSCSYALQRGPLPASQVREYCPDL